MDTQIFGCQIGYHNSRCHFVSNMIFESKTSPIFEYAKTHEFIYSVASQMIFEDLKCVSASWKNFGIMVGIDNKNIKKIQENSKKTDCFSEVIETWLGGNQENVTREKLAHAVRVAGNEGLACDILADRQFKLTLPYLLKKLRPMMSTYNILGNQLELKSSDIRNWEVVRIDVDYCMNEVVMKWFENKESKPSMEVLKDALEFINEFGLYQDLKKKYEGKNCCIIRFYFKQELFQLAFIS